MNTTPQGEAVRSNEQLARELADSCAPALEQVLVRVERAIDLYLGRSSWTQTAHLKGIEYSERKRKEMYAAHDALRDLLSVRAALAPPKAAIPSAERPSDDDMWDKTLRERDDAEAMCDKLAGAIAAHLGVEIGEHSSANSPWLNALEAVEDARPVAIPPELSVERLAKHKLLAGECPPQSVVVLFSTCARLAALQSGDKGIDEHTLRVLASALRKVAPDIADEVINRATSALTQEQGNDDESNDRRARGLAGEGDRNHVQTRRGNGAQGRDRSGEHNAGLLHPQQHADSGGGNASGIVASLQDMRARWVALIAAQGWGDQFDGDIQNIDDAIDTLSTSLTGVPK